MDKQTTHVKIIDRLAGDMVSLHVEPSSAIDWAAKLVSYDPSAASVVKVVPAYRDRRHFIGYLDSSGTYMTYLIKID